VGAGFSAFLFGGVALGEPAPTVGWHRGGFTGRWGPVFPPFCLVASIRVKDPLQLGGTAVGLLVGGGGFFRLSVWWHRSG